MTGGITGDVPCFEDPSECRCDSPHALDYVHLPLSSYAAMEAVRDAARATSAAIVEAQLESGYRVRQPRDPGLTYVKRTFPILWAAYEAGIIRLNPTEGDRP